MARGYEFYVRVARTTSQMLFVLREQKIHVFELKCIILFLYGPLIYIWWGLKFHFWVSIEKKNKNLPLSRRKFREISFRRSRSLAVQENTFTSLSLTTKKKLAAV